MKPVTVVYPIYGSFDIGRLEAAVLSALGQKHPNFRVLVSEQNKFPIFQSKAKDLGVDYLFLKKTDSTEFSFGQSRNNALKSIKDGLVYMNDADILFMDENYLSNLCSLVEDDALLIKPPLVHLRNNEVDTFLEKDKNNIFLAIADLYHPNDHVVSVYAGPIAITMNTHRNRLFMAYSEELRQYSKEERRTLAPILWYEITHPGTILTNIQNIASVGGYCEKYAGWGYEDKDLIWKLKSAYNTQDIPKEKEFTVIHLDHQKPYFNPDQKQINADTFHARQDIGVSEAISKDTYKFERYYDTNRKE
jgi:predicted glycosyltransferase involved in capsule biosynthesis